MKESKNVLNFEECEAIEELGNSEFTAGWVTGCAFVAGIIIVAT